MVTSTRIRFQRRYAKRWSIVTASSHSSCCTQWVEVRKSVTLLFYLMPIAVGTGSGVGTKLLEILHDEYPDVYRYMCVCDRFPCFTNE